jgi:hypothetical protein
VSISSHFTFSLPTLGATIPTGFNRTALLHLYRLLWLLLSEIQRAGERSGSNATNSGICPYGGAGLVKSGLRPGGRHTAIIEPLCPLFH